MSRALRFTGCLVVLLGVSLVVPAGAQRTPKPLALEAPAGPGPVFVVELHGMIDNALSRYVGRAVNDARQAQAALLIFHIDTFGGLVDAADRIRQTILAAPVPTVAFIDRNAASAGALISYAADRIVMAPGSSIGAATVVEGGSGQAAPDKYQSYMRGLMRATAEANGRDPAIAEAMVDTAVVVEGVKEAGRVLTLSAQEALRLGVADAVLVSTGAIVERYGLANRVVVMHRATWAERFLRFFGTPWMQSILILMMLGGLYLEMQSPGLGLPGLVALVGAALFFAPHYLLGLVESWEIVLFGIGLLLVLAEIFVLPGFGVAGIVGLILVVASLFAALVGNVGLQFPSIHQLAPAVATMAVTLILAVLLGWSLSRWLPRSERFNELVLTSDLGSARGVALGEAVDLAVGDVGITLTPLRPSGTARLGGRRVDVITAGDFLPVGTKIQVISVRGARVEVGRMPEDASPAETSPG